MTSRTFLSSGTISRNLTAHRNWREDGKQQAWTILIPLQAAVEEAIAYKVLSFRPEQATPRSKGKKNVINIKNDYKLLII